MDNHRRQQVKNNKNDIKDDEDEELMPLVGVIFY